MVFVNSKKYACESCIKGHRSSNCHHNDRPLYEIKKKGRPVSQCERCREARQARRVHAKCTCDTERPVELRVAGPSTGLPERKKGQRFVPTVPTLPNGLKDALKSTSATFNETLAVRQQVDALLNPCLCSDVWNCKCRTQGADDIENRKSKYQATFSDGLSTLAHVASCYSPASPPALSALSDSEKRSDSHLSEASSSKRAPFLPQISSSRNSEGGRSTNLTSAQSHISTLSQGSDAVSTIFRRIKPASILPAPTVLPPPSSLTRPEFTIVRTVSPSCGCGHRCACAGCASHDMPLESSLSPSSNSGGCCGSPADHISSYAQANVASHRANCSEDCPTCVDYDGGVELSLTGSGTTNSNIPSIKSLQPHLDSFLSRAASLPPPPPPSARAKSLDPTNVIIYPRSLFSNPNNDDRGRAFGLVNIPKLECCGGRCSCPEGQCSCENECGGCCTDEEMEDEDVQSDSVRSVIS